MAASSGTGGYSADADAPRLLAAEAELLKALRSMSSAYSDTAWQEAVSARNAALRRLLIAVNDLPVDEQELVVTRATQTLPPGLTVPPDDTGL